MIEPDPEYYRSHRKLPFIGEAGQQQLQQAKVLVIGAGGLGCPSIQWLAGCGIGTLGIADFDTVAVSNLHRQMLFNPQDAGKPKVVVAAEKIAAYNPYIKIHAHHLVADDDTIFPLIEGYDVIIDCTDNFKVRYLINDACVVAGKPVVYGAIHQTEGHVTVFNYFQSPTLRCLFPPSGTETVIESCADIGAYNMITGIIGVMMANEAVKIILQHPEVMAGTLTQFDALSGITRQISYSSAPGSREQSMGYFNKPTGLSISPAVLRNRMRQQEATRLIDVREAAERERFNIGGEHLPLQCFLAETFSSSDRNETIVVYCERGGRSMEAVAHLRRLGFHHAFSLQGGMQLWQPGH